MFAKYSRSGLALMGVPLYAGPVLAGWSGAPLSMLAALAALVGSADLDFAASLLLDSEDDAVLAELAALTETLLDENAPASALPPLDALRDKAQSTPALAALAARVAETHRKWQDQCR